MDVEFAGRRVSDGEWVCGGSIVTTFGKNGDLWAFIPQRDELCEITLDRKNGVVTRIDGKFYVVNPETVQADDKRGIFANLCSRRRKRELRHQIV